MGLQQCRRETTSSEFSEWLDYLDQDVNEFHREDYYLAQIAAEIRRMFSKKPNRIKVDDFLMRFAADKGGADTESAERVKASKSWWLGALGLAKGVLGRN